MRTIPLAEISEQHRAERELRQSHEAQKTLNALLRLALEDMELEELLRRALVMVLENSWPATAGVGAVFLVEEGSKELILKAHNGIGPQIAAHCARVPFGHCLCGQVASSGKPLHCSSIGQRHEFTYPGILPHGHYCVPIAAGGRVLGVLNVYLETGHVQEPREEEFLSTFASTLAGIIIRTQAQESLRLADKRLHEQAALVQLGQMAAVVAHELKNSLAGVRGAIQVIGHRPAPDGYDAAVIDEVIARVDAVDEFMNDLLLFARPPQPHLAPVDIIELAKDTCIFLNANPANHDVRLEIAGPPAVVMADASLLKIVLQNLLLNSAHAIQQKGTIRLSVAADARSCRIIVADDGPGIPPGVRDRIFAPFFTTKPNGTGLGLPTAKRLIDAHRGRISVECPTGGGTTVTIELPL